MNRLVQAKNALTALKQKFPDAAPDVSLLSEEQKAWLELKIQMLAEGVQSSQTIMELRKIRNQLAHATEDIPDKELQKMVSFVFNNINDIQRIIS
ncbi:hypothetical protein [Treponema putidum]|uniref:hypothetical protein n=1 Tax=Treponema putidum TaxID=221027 RepID=UPI003D915ED8